MEGRIGKDVASSNWLKNVQGLNFFAFKLYNNQKQWADLS